MKIINCSLQVVLKYDETSLENILNFCEEMILNITESAYARFCLKNVVHELIVNSVEHGYKKTSGPVDISMKKLKDCILFELKDEGCGLDIDALNLNRTAKSLSDLTFRGWGMSMLNQISRRMDIRSNTPNGTIITIEIPFHAEEVVSN